MLIDLWDDGLPSHTPFEDYCAPEVVHTGFRPKSNFFPVSCKGPYIETNYQATYRDLLELCHTKHVFCSNLSVGERTALDTLKKNHALVLKQADKGGSLVIQDLFDYEKRQTAY